MEDLPTIVEEVIAALVQREKVVLKIAIVPLDFMDSSTNSTSLSLMSIIFSMLLSMSWDIGLTINQD